MITTEIYNGQGHGNQLWAYVVTRVIAKDKGYDFGIAHPERMKSANFINLDFGKKVIGGIIPKEAEVPLVLPEGITYYYAEKKIIHPKTGEDIRTYDENLVNIKDNTKIDGLMQDEQYILHRKEEIREWIKITNDCLDYASDNICVIYVRGGEISRVKKVFLRKKYWDDGVENMRKVNKNFRFVVVTDDNKTARKIFPDFEILDFGVEKDYAILSSAHYIITANSSFSFFPIWLNQNLKMVIAPKYWAAHNDSDGYWNLGSNIYRGWLYQDRNGKLLDYQTCKKELDEYVKTHPGYFTQPKIKNNFLVISNYHNDLSSVTEYTDKYLVYDQSKEMIHPPKLDESKVVSSGYSGNNIRDYLTFIIDHYDNLPNATIFTRGDVFSGMLQNSFNEIVNNNSFTPIGELSKEYNDSWYLKHHPVKYFHSYNDFLRFCFKDPITPEYLRFAASVSYIVPKENILKLPKVFYENLRLFVSHSPSRTPGESLIIERALYTMWHDAYTVSTNMLKPLAEDFVGIPKTREPFSLKNLIGKIHRKSVRGFYAFATKIKFIKNKLPSFLQYFNGGRSFKELWLREELAPVVRIGKLFSKIKRSVSSKVRILFYQSTSTIQNLFTKKTPPEIISAYRKKIKIYDVFTYNGEADILEIRLNILYDMVDQFIIVEAPTTFSGRPKPLYFQEQKESFAPFLDKINYFVIDDYPNDKELCALADTSSNVPRGGPEHWRREFYQKESIKKALTHLRDDDICFIGDVDEIWNPLVVVDYTKNDIFKLKQEVYAYYLNNKSSESWAGTIVTKYKNIKNNCLNDLRAKDQTKYTYIKNGGWHFTSMGGINEVKRKLNDSYTKESYNTPEVQNNLEKRFGKSDYIGRNFKFWIDETELPQYLIENKEKYKNLFK